MHVAIWQCFSASFAFVRELFKSFGIPKVLGFFSTSQSTWVNKVMSREAFTECHKNFLVFIFKTTKFLQSIKVVPGVATYKICRSYFNLLYLYSVKNKQNCGLKQRFFSFKKSWQPNRTELVSKTSGSWQRVKWHHFQFGEILNLGIFMAE